MQKVKVTKEELRKVITGAETAPEALLNMFSLIVPGWEDKAPGSVKPPLASRRTINETIALFHERDDVKTDKQGFLMVWLNYGPGVDEKLDKDWTWLQREVWNG